MSLGLSDFLNIQNMNISAGCETGVEAGVSILEELTTVTGDWKINNISQSHNVFFGRNLQG